MKKQYIIIFSVFVLIFFSTFLILTEPLIELKGSQEIKINLNEEYKEDGYFAKTRLKYKNNKVIITSNINYKKVGNYEIKYKLKSFFNTKVVVRKIKVIETEKPKIKLKGKTVINLCPDEEYKEEGYEVSDNYDKKIKVKVIKEENKIIYKAKDSSGNEDTKTRIIYYKNEDGPNLTLKGDDVVVLNKNEKYEEEGYEANDICEGDITSKVFIIGHVDVLKEGIYKINYIVKNKNGKEARKTRTVFVKDPKNNNRGVIYLTFDDGPSEKITPAILDILEKEQIKATFFVTNKEEKLDYLIKREYTEGHTVALHTATHNYSYVYSSPDAYFEDLKIISDKVKRITGKESKIIRFPGGGSNTVSIKYSEGIMSYLTEEVKKRDYKYYDWNIDSEDATRRYNSEGIYENVISRLMPGRENIVLMHDFSGNYATKDALERIIKYAKANGYVFAPITESTKEIHHKIAN